MFRVIAKRSKAILVASTQCVNPASSLSWTTAAGTAQPEKSGIDKYRAKLLYQSMKRGILENDIIIGGFAREYLPKLTQQELEAYDKIINSHHMEWDLFYYVSDKKIAPPELESCAVFHKIKAFVKSKKSLDGSERL